MVAARAAVVCEPLAAFVPLQPPEAVHEVALVELQVSVDVPPLVIAEGFAVIVANGPTLTVTVAGVLAPPAPVQVIEYAVDTVRAPVDCDPLVAFAPLQPPEAVHEVALVELHVSMDAAPVAMDVGFAVKVTVAAVPDIVMVAVAIVLAPAAPLQTNENDVVAVRAPVLAVPLVAFVPLQPPEAVHDVALVELHVRVEAAPLLTVVGIALMVAVGIGSIELLLPPPQAAMKSATPAGTIRKTTHRKYRFASGAEMDGNA